LSGVIIVSTNYVTAKYGLRGFNPETFSLIWISAAAFYSLIIILLTGRRRQLVLPGNTIKRVILMGLSSGIGMLLTWAGLARLDPSFAAFLWRFLPLLVIALSFIFLGERLSVRDVTPVAIMVLGGLLSAIGRWDNVGIGMLLTLLGCGSVAIQMILAKTIIKDVPSSTLAFYRVGIGALIVAPWTLFSGKANFNVPLTYWGSTLLGALLGPCISMLFFFRSYRYWDLSSTSIVMTMEPLFVLPLTYFFLNAFPNQQELLGGGLILAGAFWLALVHYNGKRN